MRCPSIVYGNDIIYWTKMSYDTGCSSIVIKQSELPLFLQPTYMPYLNYTGVQTAVGPVQQPILTLQAKVLDSTHTGAVQEWQSMNALIMNSPERIGSQPLAGIFVCSHGNGQILYCARNKIQLIRRMPA